MTIDSTSIPQQCGKQSVEDWSCLNKTQKKRMKAKMKGDCVNKGIKNDENSVNVPTPLGNTDHKNGNIFAQHEAWMKQIPCFKITAKDSLISTIQDVIDE